MVALKQGYRYPWEVINVMPEYPAKVVVQFADWSVRTVELSHLIRGANPGVFASLEDRDFFNQVRVLDGLVTWPGELDLDPKAMYDRTH